MQSGNGAPRRAPGDPIALYRDGDERLTLSRYAEARMQDGGVLLRSRLFGTQLCLPLPGEAQRAFLDRLSAGMTAEEIRAFLRAQGLPEDGLAALLRGCVLE